MSSKNMKNQNDVRSFLDELELAKNKGVAFEQILECLKHLSCNRKPICSIFMEKDGTEYHGTVACCKDNALFIAGEEYLLSAKFSEIERIEIFSVVGG